MPEPLAPPSARRLEQALVFTFLAHAAGIVTMVACLLPGMPGGGTAAVAARAAYVAGHPWLWRVGWLGWQVTALSDLLLAAALVRTPWVPKLPAVLTLLATVAAVVPDQAGQFLWVTRGVTLAADAVRTGDASIYAAFEDRVFRLSAAWGAMLYTLAALGWTWCFAAAGTWDRRLTGLSVVLWTTFAAVGVAPLLPAGVRPPPAAVSAGNAVGFVLLQVWLALVTVKVRRRSRGREKSAEC